MTSVLVSKTPPKNSGDTPKMKVLLPKEYELPPTPPNSAGKRVTFVEVRKQQPAVSVTHHQLIAPAPSAKNASGIIQVLCQAPNHGENNNSTSSSKEQQQLQPPTTNPVTQRPYISIASKPPTMPMVMSQGQSILSGLAQMEQPISLIITRAPDSNATSKTSPSSSTANSPSTSGGPSTDRQPGKNKVGRPRKSDVQILQAEGEVSDSEMKCLVCKRVFPRIKSLEAHMRIHTGKLTILNIQDYSTCVGWRKPFG